MNIIPKKYIQIYVLENFEKALSLKVREHVKMKKKSYKNGNKGWDLRTWKVKKILKNIYSGNGQNNDRTGTKAQTIGHGKCENGK